MILIRKNGQVVSGHILQYVTSGESYQAVKVKIGREVNWRIQDDRGKELLISNNCRRKYFKSMKEEGE